MVYWYEGMTVHFYTAEPRRGAIPSVPFRAAFSSVPLRFWQKMWSYSLPFFFHQQCKLQINKMNIFVFPYFCMEWCICWILRSFSWKWMPIHSDSFVSHFWSGVFGKCWWNVKTVLWSWGYILDSYYFDSLTFNVCVLRRIMMFHLQITVYTYSYFRFSYYFKML